ncbi:DUF3597 domain-containing protein [Lichenibacterium minor]|uniref:DUF3597 domain-containing protein n=1 Tax=Lichenibacterium minor TaxID=2316528 RepID=A0A4Q2U2P8_9HYPH|nr:DUF3597 domain-containing protein [Lichenibacterium minor]RYC29127.1 DUF3597 domain-containing protein [Lichenibacterium minor]
MSMFGNIVSALFHHASAAAPTETAAADAPASAATASDPAPAGGGAATPPAAGAPSAAAAPAGSAPQSVDAKAVLAGLAAKNPQKLDWQHSIVDMMKLLGLDSSLSNRKDLAKELNYTGDMDDSASMNVWLQGEVMKKLSANGGQVPADLKA